MSDRLGANQGAAPAPGSHCTDNELDAGCGPTPVLPADARCLGCGYRLRELVSTICPECGRAFDPRDASTYRRGPRTAYWRRWARPPGVLHSALVIAFVALVTHSSSAPGGPLNLLFPFGACFMALIAAGLLLGYIIHAILSLADRRRAHEDRGAHPKRGAWRWLIVPSAILALIVNYVTMWPMRARFGLSQSAFEAEAQLRMGMSIGDRMIVQDRGKKTLGLYRIVVFEAWDMDDDSKPHAIKFITGGTPFGDWGLLYDPTHALGPNQPSVLPGPWSWYWHSK